MKRKVNNPVVSTELLYSAWSYHCAQRVFTQKASRLYRLSLCGHGSFHCQSAQRHDMQASLVSGTARWKKEKKVFKVFFKVFFLGTLSPNKTQLLQRHHTYIFLPLCLCSPCFTGVLHF